MIGLSGSMRDVSPAPNLDRRPATPATGLGEPSEAPALSTLRICVCLGGGGAVGLGCACVSRAGGLQDAGALRRRAGVRARIIAHLIIPMLYLFRSGLFGGPVPPTKLGLYQTWRMLDQI